MPSSPWTTNRPRLHGIGMIGKEDQSGNATGLATDQGHHGAIRADVTTKMAPHATARDHRVTIEIRTPNLPELTQGPTTQKCPIYE